MQFTAIVDTEPGTAVTHQRLGFGDLPQAKYVGVKPDRLVDLHRADGNLDMVQGGDAKEQSHLPYSFERGILTADVRDKCRLGLLVST